MPDILYGKGSYRRDNGNFTSLDLVNMFPEAAPTVEQGVAILSRPGVTQYAVRGVGPVHEVYNRAGFYAGDTFALSGNDLYKGAVNLGAINGSGPVRIATSDTELVITRGQSAYSYNGTDLQAITFPDGANVVAVTYIGERFVFVREDSHRFYWSEIGDGRTINALSYTSADDAPDHLRDVIAIGDVLYAMGDESVQVYYLNSTNVALPFTKISQRTAPRGVVDTGCAIEFDNAVHFIGNDFIVYRMTEVPLRISNHGLEERIGESENWRLFTFRYQGHSFLCVRVDGGTWVFDPAGGTDWPEFRTYGLDNFIGQCACTPSFGAIFGSSFDGTLYQFGDVWTDDGAPLERRFTGAFPIKGGVVPVDVLEIEANVGATTASVGIGADPQIEVRASRDGGNSFGSYRTASLGEQGERRKRPRWRRFGFFDAPGAVFDFRMTDPAPLRVSAVLINEPASGRSR